MEKKEVEREKRGGRETEEQREPCRYRFPSITGYVRRKSLKVGETKWLLVRGEDG